MASSDAWSGIATSERDFVSCLHECGVKGAAVADFDWSRTALGPIATWPIWLRTVVQTMLGSAHPMALRLGPELITLFNDGFVPFLGARADTALGKPWAEVWPETFAEMLPIIRRVLAGESVWRQEMPLWVTRNGFEELTYWTFAFSPVRDDRGRIVGVLNVTDETTEAVKTRAAIEKANESLAFEVEKALHALAARDDAEREQTMLRHELIHRMKNMLSVITAMVGQSIRSAATVEQAAEVTAARLAAYARAQEVFTEGAWSDADIGAVVAAAIAPHAAGRETRIRVNGPELRLNSQHALAIALAVHELATNATKYGALSDEAGRVEIDWNCIDETFRFVWREVGGPPVAAPEETGFGSTLTDRVVPAYFSGRAARAFDASGVVYTLSGHLPQRGGEATR